MSGDIRKVLWGLHLTPNMAYTKTTLSDLHISNASLDPHTANKQLSSKVYIVHENEDYLIANLHTDFSEQIKLNLNIGKNDQIILKNVGNSATVLYGYISESVWGDIEENDFQIEGTGGGKHKISTFLSEND